MSVCSLLGGGTQASDPRSFPGGYPHLGSQVPSRGTPASGPRSVLGGTPVYGSRSLLEGTTVLTRVPPAGFPQDFLVFGKWDKNKITFVFQLSTVICGNEHSLNGVPVVISIAQQKLCQSMCPSGICLDPKFNQKSNQQKQQMYLIFLHFILIFQDSSIADLQKRKSGKN